MKFWLQERRENTVSNFQFILLENALALSLIFIQNASHIKNHEEKITHYCSNINVSIFLTEVIIEPYRQR